MKHKKVIVLTTAIFFTTLVQGFAQETGLSSWFAEPKYHWHIGLDSGYAFNWLDTTSGFRTDTEYRGGHGFNIAIPVSYQIFPWLAVGAEPRYIMKNYSLYRTGDTYDYRDVYRDWTNSFFDFPLYAKLSLGWERLKFFANLGGYLGVWFDSRIKGKQREETLNAFNGDSEYFYEYNEQVSFDSTRDNQFDAGLLAGGGLQYAFDGFTLFGECRFYYGLTNLQKNYQRDLIPRYNNTISVNLGILFNAGIFDRFKK